MPSLMPAGGFEGAWPCRAGYAAGRCCAPPGLPCTLGVSVTHRPARRAPQASVRASMQALRTCVYVYMRMRMHARAHPGTCMHAHYSRCSLRWVSYLCGSCVADSISSPAQPCCLTVAAMCLSMRRGR